MIKSRIDGRDYIYQANDDEYVAKINKNKTDASLRRLRNAVTVICDEIKKIYNDNWNLYNLIEDEAVFSGDFQLDDGEIYALKEARDRIAELETVFQTQDDAIEFVLPKNLTTLSDLGYHSVHNRTPFYEKIIEDSEDQEIVEEIIALETGEYLRRKRTIIWEITNYGRSSKSIKYKKLPIGKRLNAAIQNTTKPVVP